MRGGKWSNEDDWIIDMVAEEMNALQALKKEMPPAYEAALISLTRLRAQLIPSYTLQYLLPATTNPTDGSTSSTLPSPTHWLPSHNQGSA